MLAHVGNIDEFIALLEENLGGEDMTKFDLPTTRFPTGGGKHWVLPTADDPDGEALKSIEGVIIGSAKSRSYYITAYGEGEANAQPDCSSEDGYEGTPYDENANGYGGSCEHCAMSQWGSGRGNSQACGEYRTMFVLRDGANLPVVVRVPGTSIKAFRKYKADLFDDSMPVTAVVTSIGLHTTASTDGVDYSVATFTKMRVLEAEEKSRIHQYYTAISRMLR